jgi:hypothetical protein
MIGNTANSLEEVSVNGTGASALDYLRQEKYRNAAATLDNQIPALVSNSLFDDQQFPTNAREDQWGSQWQKIVFMALEQNSRNILEPEWAERYWNENGRQNLRRALNRRRNCVTNSMKTAFIGMWWGTLVYLVVVVPLLWVTKGQLIFLYSIFSQKLSRMELNCSLLFRLWLVIGRMMIKGLPGRPQQT